ncbi:MAG: FUSC family protein [Nocardioides sp.]
MSTSIFYVDREGIKPRSGVLLVAAIVGISLIEMVLGEVAVPALIAAYFVTRVGTHARGGKRWLYMSIAIVVGTGLSLLALVAGDNTVRAVLLWTAAIYFTGLAVAYGRSIFYACYFFVFWLLLVMLESSRSAGEPWHYVASFLIGGVVALIVMTARIRFGLIDDSPTDPDGTPQLRDVATSDIGVFALMWALTMAVAIAVGYTFWSVEPFWVASTLLVVMQPDVAKGTRTGIQRGIGSATGGLLALALIAIFPGFVGSDLLLVYFLAVTALCVAFYRANYLIYAFFMTQAVVIYYGHEVGDFGEAGGQRILGVLLGVVIGLVGLGVQARVIASRHQRNQASTGS